MKKTKPIRDPLHNYIELTPIEQSIVALPEFQRLRFVMQNSTAYLTYPNNMHGRFVHSLGVMHIAGEMFCKSLQNSSKEDLREYLDSSKEKIREHAGKLEVDYEDLQDGPQAGWDTLLRDSARFNHFPMHGDPLLDISKEDLFIINTLWQVVRMAGLVHDLGHFPGSHIFESAVKKLLESGELLTNPDGDDKDLFYLNHRARLKAFRDKILNDFGQELADELDDLAIHEIVGVSLFHSLFENPSNSDSDAETSYRRLIRSMAKKVLLYPEPSQVLREHEYIAGDEQGVLMGLHGLIAGEVDADRLDYCLRDPMESGLESGAFDLKRIVDSFIMVEHGGRFVFMPSEVSISAIEAFYHQRYLLYKYLFHHHNVVRTDGILEEILVRLIGIASGRDETDGNLVKLLRGYELWFEERGRNDGNRFMPIDKFWKFDDSWMRSMLVAVYEYLVPKNVQAIGDNSNLFLLLETLLHRKTDNIVSMWKREGDFLQDIESMIGEMDIDGEKRTLLDDKLRQGYEGPSFSRIDDLGRELKKLGVLLIHRKPRPKTNKSLLVRIGDKTVDLEEISPYSKSLRNVVGIKWQVHISFVGQSLKPNIQIVEQCRAIVRDYFTRDLVEIAKKL